MVNQNRGPEKIRIAIPEKVQVYCNNVRDCEVSTKAVLYFFLQGAPGVKLQIPKGLEVSVVGRQLELKVRGTRAKMAVRTLQQAITAAGRRLVLGEKVIKSKLILRGIGYRASAMEGGNWKLRLGYSHEIILPTNIELKTQLVKDAGVKKVAKRQSGKDLGSKKKIGESQQVILEGASRSRVAPLVNQIKKLRPPGKYNEKGVYGSQTEKR